MKLSFTYYLTILILKLKGVKSNFSFDPIDFKKIRKDNVENPKGKFFIKGSVRQFKVLNSTVTEVGQHEGSSGLLLFVHGGAFIAGPGQHHWDTLKEMSFRTDQTIWMCNYPKAPETTISQISENIDSIYSEALKEYSVGQITLMGDSAGGTLVTGLIQRLVKNNASLPKQIILVSPVMDSSMTNLEIEKVDQTDPMLSKVGILSAKKMCAGDIDLKNEMISPLYGSFKGFPRTVLFLAENDITYPDQKLAVEKLTAAEVDLRTIVGERMPHIWPFLPVMKEAKEALNQIIELLNE